MKLWQLEEQIKHLKKNYPNSEDWDVYVETEMFTLGNIYSQDEENKKHNEEVFKKLNEAREAGWNFIDCHEYDNNGELMSTDYYKEIAGGIGLDPQQKAILICINY